MQFALLILLTVQGYAQNPTAQASATTTAAPQTTSASTATVVAASTEAPVAVSSTTTAPEAEGRGFKVAGEQPTAILANPITVKFHKGSGEWEPVSLRIGGDPGQAHDAFSRKVKGFRNRSGKSKATAAARVHPHKDDKLLIVSVYPAALKPLGTYMEVRYLIAEGWLEEVKVAAIHVKNGQAWKWGAEDTYTLAQKGIAFSEDFPDDGSVKVSALNPKPGKASVNGASVSGAHFGGDQLGLISFSYGTHGVSK